MGVESRAACCALRLYRGVLQPREATLRARLHHSRSGGGKLSRGECRITGVNGTEGRPGGATPKFRVERRLPSGPRIRYLCTRLRWRATLGCEERARFNGPRG